MKDEQVQLREQIMQPTKHASLKNEDLLPGQRVSVDHFISAIPGRLYKSRGGTHLEDKYHGGAIFVDHASGHISIRHQVSLQTTDTIHSKLSYEAEAFSSGVTIQAYHSDKGTFAAKDFVNAIDDAKQTIKYSGSHTGFQNGVAERAIQTIVSMARTMMLHAALRTPEKELSSDLWPMAMDYAVFIYNRLPNQSTGYSPIKLWTRTSFNLYKLTRDCHVWGAPAYVLEPSLAKSGGKLPKWQPRSRRGMFLGFSPDHSSLVSLVLNTKTHSITGQYHTVIDDAFTTVSTPDDAVNPEEWLNLLSCRVARVNFLFYLDKDSSTAAN